MWPYWLRRFAYFGGLWLSVIVVSFLLFQVVPNDPARTVLGPNASTEQVDALRARLGLDRSVVDQIQSHLAHVLQFDFGRSLLDDRDVFTEVASRLWVTLSTIVISVILVCSYGVFAAIAAARTGSSRVLAGFDHVLSTLPTLFVAVVIALLASASGLVPVFRDLYSVESWLALLPAALALALFPMALVSRVLRHAMDELRDADFVRTARAKGLTEPQVRYRHMLRNAVIPVVASLSNLIPALFTACYVVEVVFSLPGTGSLLVRSILQRDLPMLQGVVALNSLAAVVCLFAVESLYPWIDPRVRTRES